MIILLSVCDVDSVLFIVIVANPVDVPVNKLGIHEILGRDPVLGGHAEKRFYAHQHLWRVRSFNLV